MLERLFISVIAATLLAGMGLAQEGIREEQIEFADDRRVITFDGNITGSEIIDYVFAANTGDQIKVSLDTNHSANYFNVLPPASESAVFIGSIEGNDYVGEIEETGDYRIRVYLMRSAARRDEQANYSLSVDLNDAQEVSAQPNSVAASYPPDYADGLQGGPDFWEVTGLPQGETVVFRQEPAATAAAVSQAAPGTVLRNGGCTMADEVRWCRVSYPNDDALIGWVPGNFLKEAMQNPGLDYGEDALVAGTEFHATGTVPCVRSTNSAMERCDFGVVRQGSGSAQVTVFWPDQSTRMLEFIEGDYRGSGSAQQVDDNHIVTIGSERFIIPDAVIFGG